MRLTKLSSSLIAILFVLFISLNLARAQEGIEAVVSSSFFEAMGELPLGEVDVVIYSDFKKLIRTKMQEKYIPAKVYVVVKEDTIYRFDSEIKTRGNSRKEICFFPPVKLKVKKAALEKNQLNREFNKYKLVTQCKSGSVYQDYVNKEYMAYQLLQDVYPVGLKVVPVNIKYIQSGDNPKKAKKQRVDELSGFIIESEEHLANRVNAINIRRTKSAFHHLDRFHTINLSLFQYMIGNTDWAVPNLHNLKLIKIADVDKMIAVPYDFDYSGLVNTIYAVPHGTLSIKSVKQRLYRGPGCEEEEVNEVIELYRTKKDDLIKTIETCPVTDQKGKESMIKYIEGFFKELDNGKQLLRTMKFTQS